MSVGGSGVSFTQLVEPRTGTEDATGMCLQFAQSVFGAPVAHRSATDAANATKFRHHTFEMPDVSVPVWFDHYGTYQGEYANWGHVVAWVPGNGFLSSPVREYGQQWFPSINAVERTFRASFRFWSEDINGLRVAESLGDDMTPEQSAKLDAIYAGLYGPANVGAGEISWKSLNGVQKAQFGNLEIDIYTQKLVAQLVGQVAGLTEAVKAIPGGNGVDMAALESAAERGAREALSGLVLKADS